MLRVVCRIGSSSQDPGAERSRTDEVPFVQNNILQAKTLRTPKAIDGERAAKQSYELRQCLMVSQNFVRFCSATATGA